MHIITPTGPSVSERLLYIIVTKRKLLKSDIRILHKIYIETKICIPSISIFLS